MSGLRFAYVTTGAVRFRLAVTLFEVTPLDSPRSYRLSGELDLSTADQLSQVLAEECQSPGDISLDLADLTFIDSTGLRILLDCHRALGATGELILRKPTGEVARTFEVSGIDRVEGIRVER
jgi:anti-anti-sigma factor